MGLAAVRPGRTLPGRETASRPSSRHALISSCRTCSGYLLTGPSRWRKWMPGTSPGMTEGALRQDAKGVDRRSADHDIPSARLTGVGVAGESPAERRSSRPRFHREPCVTGREAVDEASVAAHAGGVIERRKLVIRSAETVECVEGHIARTADWRGAGELRGVEEPRHVCKHPHNGAPVLTFGGSRA